MTSIAAWRRSPLPLFAIVAAALVVLTVYPMIWLLIGSLRTKTGYGLTNFTDLNDNTCALVAEDRGEDPFRICAAQGVGVRVTHAGVLDLDEDLASLWWGDVDFDDLEGLSNFEGDRCATFHARLHARTENSLIRARFVASTT